MNIKIKRYSLQITSVADHTWRNSDCNQTQSVDIWHSRKDKYIWKSLTIHPQNFQPRDTIINVNFQIAVINSEVLSFLKPDLRRLIEWVVFESTEIRTVDEISQWLRGKLWAEGTSKINLPPPPLHPSQTSPTRRPDFSVCYAKSVSSQTSSCHPSIVILLCLTSVSIFTIFELSVVRSQHLISHFIWIAFCVLRRWR